MAKKQAIFLKLNSSVKSRLIQSCLALITVFLFIVVSPVFAQAPSISSFIPNSTSSSAPGIIRSRRENILSVS